MNKLYTLIKTRFRVKKQLVIPNKNDEENKEQSASNAKKMPISINKPDTKSKDQPIKNENSNNEETLPSPVKEKKIN